MAEIPCLAPEAPRLVSMRYRRGPRCLRGGRQPLAGPRQRRRTRGAAGAIGAGSTASARTGPGALDPRTPLARAGGLWLPWRKRTVLPVGRGRRAGCRAARPPFRATGTEPLVTRSDSRRLPTAASVALTRSFPPPLDVPAASPSVEPPCAATHRCGAGAHALGGGRPSGPAATAPTRSPPR